MSKKIFYKTLSIVAASCTLILGILFLLSWEFHLTFLLSISSFIALTSYTSAVLLILSSLAILLCFIPTKINYTALLGTLILLMSLFDLSAHIWDLDFGPSLFLHFLAPSAPIVYPSIISLYGLLITGIILLLLSPIKYSKNRSLCSIVLSICLFLLGSFALFGFLPAFRDTLPWILKELAPLYTMLSLIILSISLIAKQLYDDLHFKMPFIRALPLFVSTLFALCSIFLYFQLKNQRSELIKEMTASTATQVELEIHNYFLQKVETLKLLGSLIESNHSPKEVLELVNAQKSTEQTPDSLFSAWLDPNFKSQVINPTDQELLDAILISPKFHYDLLENTIAKKNLYAMVYPDPTTIKQASSFHLIIFLPIYWDLTFQGWLIEAFDVKEFLQIALMDFIENNYGIAVFERGAPILNLNGTLTSQFSFWDAKGFVKIANVELTFRLFPNFHLLELVAEDRLIILTFIGSLCIAIALGGVIYLLQINQQRCKELEKAENKREEVLNTLQNTLNAAEIGAWEWNVPGDIFLLKDYQHPLCGSSPFFFCGSLNELIDKHIVPEDREPLRLSIQTSLKNHTPTDYSFRCLFPSEKIRFFLSKGKVFLDPNNRPIKMSGICWDITPIKLTELSLKTSEERIQNILAISKEWIWEIDANLNFTYSNDIVQTILGFSPQEILGKNFFSFLNLEDHASEKKVLEQAIEENRGWSEITQHWKHKNKGERCLQSTAQAILNSSGQLIAFRGAHRDVTEMKRIEKSKNEFISMTSHELRTPLTSIQGALAMILTQEGKPEDTKELLTIAYRNAERLAAIINDILDIEKFQLGKLAIEMKPIHILSCIQEAIFLSQPIAKKTNATLIQEPCHFDPIVDGDKSRLIQVLLNLISNAVKFSPVNGSVWISIEKIDHRVKVSIRDQGPGIPIEFQEKIFEKFEQADASDARLFRGTGLGLSICKTLIEYLGGTIGFTTKKGTGSTFYFELPLRQ